MTPNNVTSHQLIFSPEILRLLTDLLYPDPRMAIREILANAADAITMAMPLYPEGFRPQILVKPDRLQSTLTIDDNGIGLKAHEVNVLNTVGADEDKRRRFEEILKSNPGRDGIEQSGIKEQLANLIGRYAIGRLACLCVADRVDIQSKSLVDTASPGIQWTMREGIMNTETALFDREKPGTRVVLHIKEKFRDHILLADKLEQIVREYGAFLPYNLHINTPMSPPVNVQNPVIYEVVTGTSLNPIPYRPSSDPQRSADSLDERYQSLWDVLYGDLKYDPPLTILPIATEGVRGMLFIPSDPAFAEMGRVRLWCKRIFVKSNEDDLLPAWARPLLSGVLDCQIDPNLSRTDLLRSDEREYKALKEQIEKQIVQQLGLLVAYGAQWEKVVTLYRLPLVYGANLNSELLRRVGHRIPFRKAVRVKGPDAGGSITLESYKNQMQRRSGGDDELPVGTTLDQNNPASVSEHRQTLYYYTGEGSLAGIIERETVLHAPSHQDVALLQEWCKLNHIKAMNVGHELPFEDVRGMDKFVEAVRDAIGQDADRRKLQIRAVKMDHRPDIPCMLTSENTRQRRAEQYTREYNAKSDKELLELARRFEAPVKIEELSRADITDFLVQAHLWADEHDDSGDSAPGIQDVLYLNMSNELMCHLALERMFETADEMAFRAQALHEVWHAAKLARGEPIVQPNSDHHSQTAMEFLRKTILDLYEPLRRDRAELEHYRQKEIGKAAS